MADATHYLDDVDEPVVQLTTGTILSGTAHAGLIVWLISGWGLTQEPLPFETVDVSVVSTEDYAALVNRNQPTVDVTEPEVLQTPQLQEVLPEVTPETPVEIAQPEVAPEVPVEEIPPEALEPLPQVEDVPDDVPVLDAPAVPVAPDLPVVTDTPQVDEAPRIAPEIAEAPPLEADVAPVIQQEATPESESAEIVEEAQEAAAPEEATTEIVTEAETPSGAVEVALRPPSRPDRPQPVPEPEVEPEVETEAAVEEPVEDTTIDDILNDVVTDPVAEPAADPGPPFTAGQMEAFGRAISPCWIVDTGSIASTVTVTVSFQLGEDRRVVGSVVELVSNSPGDPAAVRAAFDRARTAVLNCQRQNGGFPLDAAQFEQWRNVEMTFNPESMRIR